MPEYTPPRALEYHPGVCYTAISPLLVIEKLMAWRDWVFGERWLVIRK